MVQLPMQKHDFGNNSQMLSNKTNTTHARLTGLSCNLRNSARSEPIATAAHLHRLCGQLSHTPGRLELSGCQSYLASFAMLHREQRTLMPQHIFQCLTMMLLELIIYQ